MRGYGRTFLNSIDYYVNALITRIPAVLIFIFPAYYEAYSILTGQYGTGPHSPGVISVVWIWLVGVWGIICNIDELRDFVKHRTQKFKPLIMHSKNSSICDMIACIARPLITIIMLEALMIYPALLLCTSGAPFKPAPSVSSLIMTLPLLVAHVLTVCVIIPSMGLRRISVYVYLGYRKARASRLYR